MGSLTPAHMGWSPVPVALWRWNMQMALPSWGFKGNSIPIALLALPWRELCWGLAAEMALCLGCTPETLGQPILWNQVEVAMLGAVDPPRFTTCALWRCCLCSLYFTRSSWGARCRNLESRAYNMRVPSSRSPFFEVILHLRPLQSSAGIGRPALKISEAPSGLFCYLGL